MRIALVAAVAENGVIGREGTMPWRLATDMRRFRDLTMGKPVVMGRKTWESFPRRPLPGRLNIVVTRNRDYRAEGAETAASLDAAIALAHTLQPEAAEIAVLGGGEIYAQAMALADRLVITHVLARIPGDTRFPPIDPEIWYSVIDEAVPAGERDSHPTRFVVYERRKRGG